MKIYAWSYGALNGRINAPSTKVAKVTLIAALSKSGVAKVTKKLPKGTVLKKVGLTKAEATGQVAVLAGVDEVAVAGARANKAAIKRSHDVGPQTEITPEQWFMEMKKATSFSDCRLIYEDGTEQIVCGEGAEVIVPKGVKVCKKPL